MGSLEIHPHGKAQERQRERERERERKREKKDISQMKTKKNVFEL